MTIDQLNKLADVADVAPRTLTKYLADLPVQPRVKRRIERALASSPELAPAARMGGAS